MAYVNPNFRTKKALKEALKRHIPVTVYAPGIGSIPHNGNVTLEGPHYPEPHTWYANGVMRNGKLVRVT